MSLKCAHISDVHWRGLKRHDEYVDSFKDMFSKLRELRPDVIFIGGDIVHSKTQGISPELIEKLTWWFRELADIAPTHVILGNHDGLIMNSHRQDAITPIVEAINSDNIILYKDSGTYPIRGFEGFCWNVFSCFDQKNWDNVNPDPDAINIAVYHGAVVGSKTDTDWELDGEVDLSFFEGYDFGFLGDIHQQQFLNEQRTIAYPGSTIQQNYGETPEKGFLFWEISSKNDFSVSFHEVRNRFKHITISWLGTVQETVESVPAGADGCRFRVKVRGPISQAEIKQLYASLRENFNSHEIVLKHEQMTESSIVKEGSDKFKKENLRDISVQKSILRKFYEAEDLTDEVSSDLDDMMTRYLSMASRTDVARNVKWSIKKINFDNTFAYGKENYINFDSLHGIVGIFGKNRAGKSSIPGTIMFNLYNTTDRGSMSNLHVINARKGHCTSRAHVVVNGKNYLIERNANRYVPRKGPQRAITSLNLFEVDDDSNILNDLNGEQRRDTEKILRKLVGTSEDFLLTSLASQGDMSNFIKFKSAQRKAILTKFLDLCVFDDMFELAKSDSIELKAMLKDVPDQDWDLLISEKQELLESQKSQRDQVELDIMQKRSDLSELRITLASDSSSDIVTQGDVDRKSSEIESLKDKNIDLNDCLNKNEKILGEIQVKVDALHSLKKDFPIDDLRNRKSALEDLERTLLELQHQKELEKQLLKRQENSIKILNEVPCGDQFPSCKFIKDSHRNKKKIESQIEKTNEISDKVRQAQKSVKVIQKENLSEKIEKYNNILKKESTLLEKLSDLKIENTTLKNNLLSNSELINSSILELDKMKINVCTGDEADRISDAKDKIFRLESSIRDLDASRISLAERSTALEIEVNKAKSDKEKYHDISSRWKVFNLFMRAVSKKGIPLQIISSLLPSINVELSKILQDVVGFTVELESDEGSNDIEIYINYGDSRRVIEVASGMEKLMASLAIRVALINVTTLPKSDILIIDEGFGALDDTNVEACSRLLESLKRWFKCIMIISHVDSVKDIVDDVIDITKTGKDSLVNVE